MRKPTASERLITELLGRVARLEPRHSQRPVGEAIGKEGLWCQIPALSEGLRPKGYLHLNCDSHATGLLSLHFPFLAQAHAKTHPWWEPHLRSPKHPSA